MKMHARALTLLVGCALAFTSAQALADANVKVCGHDVWPGDPRMDFSEAVSIGGRITFDCSGVILLTRTHGLTKDTEIDGGGGVTLDGQNQRMFGLGSSVPRLTFRNIRLEHGGTGASGLPGSVVSGEGFVSFLGHTSISRSVKPLWIMSGSATFQGARIAGNSGPVVVVSEGELEISHNTTFTDNIGQSVGTGPTVRVRIHDTQFFRNGGANFGGTLAGNCEVIVTNSWFADNHTGENGGALSTRCKLTIEGTQFERNIARGDGGAVYLGIGANATMNKVQFRENQSGQNGGAIGAVWNIGQRGGLGIRHGRFERNSAVRAGGAIYVGEASRLDIRFGTFLGNAAQNAGGAIYVRQSPLTASNSLFLKNRANGTGGAIESLCMPMNGGHIVNSIVAGNSAAGGGAFYGTHVTFLNATIVSNGDLPVRQGTGCAASSAIAFANTIIEGGPRGACAGGDATRVFKDLGHNLQFPGKTCGAAMTSAMPLLGAFFAPFVPFSPATGNGDAAVCMAPPIGGRDIYGAHRPQGSACSIGAVEGDLSQLVDRFFKRRRGDLR